MSLLDKLAATFAPHECLGCSVEGALLCADCRLLFTQLPERCYRCRKLSPGNRTCRGCRSSTPLYSIGAVTVYEYVAKELIWRLKFQGAQAAAGEMAALMAEWLPSKEVLLVPVPTATGRVRQRGYDQARLLARELSGLTGLPYANVLGRLGQHHQVGASREQRVNQLKQAYCVIRPESVAGAHIVLVDDVLTTGATLEAAGRTLKAAGAKRIDAVVFAQA